MVDDPSGWTQGQGIVGGSSVQGWDSVVVVLADTLACTGVVVSPDVVLTSGQCIDGFSGTVEVYWCDDGANEGYYWFRESNEYYIHPSYDPTTYSGDIAAIRLNDLSPTDPMPLNCDPPDASWIDPSAPLTGVGFGSDQPSPETDYIKREAPIAFDSWDSDFLFHNDPDHGFCTGDNGAPVLTDHGGDWAVAALASHGDSQCVGWGAATRTDAHVDWLEGLFPGWDVCGDGDDDDSADDDDLAGDDDDTSAEDDDTGDDDLDDDDIDTDDDIGMDDDGTGPDCSCQTTGAGDESSWIVGLGVMLLALRRW